MVIFLQVKLSETIIPKISIIRVDWALENDWVWLKIEIKEKKKNHKRVVTASEKYIISLKQWVLC